MNRHKLNALLATLCCSSPPSTGRGSKLLVQFVNYNHNTLENYMPLFDICCVDSSRIYDVATSVFNAIMTL
ncbi:hypothetical protein PsorP6_004884 [Peronosclerospora sorghi]|uniref:Uncharacterized protein n=1 Tax=Peronosclerospora sorghi TaxID=230839 RepID=A0ACC0W7X0_9STRA|nr:hypothetical protein PsorP6_004884 [Peronosclerospora sorghi]